MLYSQDVKNIIKETKSPIIWQGCKKKELDKIYKYIVEAGDFNKFIDVCGGGGIVSIFLCKLQSQLKNNYTVCYNDTNKNLCSFFNNLKNIENLEEMIIKLEQIEQTKENYIKINQELSKDNSKVKLEEFLFLTANAYRGNLGHSMPNMRRSDLDGKLYLEGRISNRYPYWFDLVDICKDLQITNLDMKDIIEREKNNEKTLIYIDPPYLNSLSYGLSKLDIINIFEYLVKIMLDNNYKLKIILHVDFSGYIYMNLKDKIKEVYQSTFRMCDNFNKYQCIITNY